MRSWLKSYGRFVVSPLATIQKIPKTLVPVFREDLNATLHFVQLGCLLGTLIRARKACVIFTMGLACPRWETIRRLIDFIIPELNRARCSRRRVNNCLKVQSVHTDLQINLTEYRQNENSESENLFPNRDEASRWDSNRIQRLLAKFLLLTFVNVPCAISARQQPWNGRETCTGFISATIYLGISTCLHDLITYSPLVSIHNKIIRQFL